MEDENSKFLNERRKFSQDRRIRAEDRRKPFDRRRVNLGYDLLAHDRRINAGDRRQILGDRRSSNNRRTAVIRKPIDYDLNIYENDNWEKGLRDLNN